LRIAGPYPRPEKKKNAAPPGQWGGGGVSASRGRGAHHPLTGGPYLWVRCPSSVKRSLMESLVASRFIFVMLVVRGISLGHTRLQFCALPQSWIPPSPISPRVRSSAFFAPVGCRLKSRAWAIAEAPMKWLSIDTWGQASRHAAQVMHSLIL